MTIRYERSTFPGGYRPYDDHLNPQIDTLDTGEAVASKFGLTLPPPLVVQSQRYVSRTVDVTDSHPVDGPQQPRYHLDGVPVIIEADKHPQSTQIRLPSPLQVPSIPISNSPRYRAPPPLSAPSQSTGNPPVRPRRKPGRPRKHAPPPGTSDKLTPGNLSLLDKAINIPALKEPAAPPGIDHLFIRPMSSVPRLTRPLPSKSPQMRLRQLTPPHTPDPAFTSMVRACSDRIVSAVKASCVQLLVKEREEKDALRRELDDLKRLHLVPPYSADIVHDMRPRTPPLQVLKRPSTAPPMALSPVQAGLKKRRVDHSYSFEDHVSEATVLDDGWSRRGSRSESVNSELTQVDDGGAAESFRSALEFGMYRKLEQLGSSRASSRSSHSSRGTVNGNNDVVLAKFFE